MTSAPFLAEKLQKLDEDLGQTLPRVLGEVDSEAIHDMRVAIRRLRVILKLARPVYGRFLTDAVRQGFTDFHRATGVLRDEEVLEETLAASRWRDAQFPRLGAGAERPRAHAPRARPRHAPRRRHGANRASSSRR